MKYGVESPLSTLTPSNEQDPPDLGGMPDFSVIEHLALLREDISERIKESPQDSDQAFRLEQLLSKIFNHHFLADHHDSSNQCNDRMLLREHAPV